MQITLTERFQKDVIHLTPEDKEAIFSTMLKIPSAIKDIHRHEGIGLRKIHSSGIFEARIGLGLRIIFGYQNQELCFHRVGNHDEIRRYLKAL